MSDALDAGSSAARPPRYWLSNTTLHGRDGKPGFEVTAPRLVELLPNNSVRSVQGTPEFSGGLPKDVLELPRKDRGLMLYAQRTSELRWNRADGASFGRLHPGALVSVTPDAASMARVGNLPFELGTEPIVAYVERAALGVDAREPPDIKPTGRQRAVRLQGATAFVEDPASNRMLGAWNSNCADLWVTEGDKVVSQYAHGVELRGFYDGLVPGIVVYHASLRCPAGAVAQNASELLLYGTPGVANPKKISDIPVGYQKYQPTPQDFLAAAIQRKASVFLLQHSEKGISCDEWKFQGSSNEGSFVRREPVNDDGKRAKASFAFSYVSKAPNPSVLNLTKFELDGSAALKCSCDYSYAVMQATSDELRMLGRPLPDKFVAYDPNQAERWFFSKERCSEARKQAQESIDRDGTTATQLGFHAVTTPYGI